jgi:diguanylate cyclase (GGDEF)-like protein
MEMIREDIEKTVIEYDNLTLSITVSIGVFVKSNEILTLDEVIKKADDIMYLSKSRGKNRITIV